MVQIVLGMGGFVMHAADTGLLYQGDDVEEF